MIGVAIPVLNERGLLPACLRSVDTALGNLFEYSKVETQAHVVLAIGASTVDGSQKIVDDFKSYWPDAITYSWESEPGGSVGYARHVATTGCLSAGARIVLSTDADCTVSPAWAVSMWRILASDFARVERLGSVWGSVQLPIGSRYAEAWENSRRSGDLPFRLFEQNCAFTAEAYTNSRGWSFSVKNEGPALLRRLRNAGYGDFRIPEAQVMASDRANGRVKGGMACAIRGLALDGKLYALRLLA